tara:strand:+ start:204 stop:797 length:594 start_codon:yes stop_codon:yes gene_type:complete
MVLDWKADNVRTLLEKYDKVMHLKFAYDQTKKLHPFPTENSSTELEDTLKTRAKSHNQKVLNQEFVDAGFDLFSPLPFVFEGKLVNKVDFEIKCSANIVKKDGTSYPTGFYLYPRSSLSKTPLQLANSVGIIDSGYRGNIIGAFLNWSDDTYIMDSYSRPVQITAPDLCPILVEMVDSVDELGTTERGEGGFGSTGK